MREQFRQLTLSEGDFEMTISDEADWSSYAIALGEYLGRNTESKERSVFCVTAPETELFSLLCAFGALSAVSSNDANQELLTFNSFMSLDADTSLYWKDEGSGKRKSGRTSYAHDYQGGGRMVVSRDGVGHAVFRNNFNRFKFQFTEGRARRRSGDSALAAFYDACKINGDAILANMKPTVISHGNKNKLLSVSRSVYLGVADKKLPMATILDVGSEDAVGRGSFRVFSDVTKVVDNKCALAIFIGSRRFDRLVHNYAGSNLLFLFRSDEFSEDVRSRILEISGRSAQDAPDVPTSIRSQNFMVARY
jgi:hypothetical protein